jgi:uncharacterized protein (TIGR02145 family)
MRRSLLLTLATLLCASTLFVTGCNNEPPVEPAPTPEDTILVVNEDPIEVSSSGRTGDIEVEANGEWSAVVDPATATWLTLTGETGDGNGTITWKAAANGSVEPREAEVVVTSGELTKRVPVKQEGADADCYIDKNEFQFTAAGGDDKIVITGNLAWTAVVDNAGENDWLSVSPASGEGSGEIEITADAKTTIGSRSATITIDPDWEDASKPSFTITVTQTGVATVFSLNPTEKRNIAGTGEEFDVAVTCNTTWAVQSNSATWVTVTNGTGDGNGSFHVAVAASTGISERSTNLVVKASDETTLTFAIHQLAGRLAVVKFVDYDDPSQPFDPSGVKVMSGTADDELRVRIFSEVAWRVRAEGTLSVGIQPSSGFSTPTNGQVVTLSTSANTEEVQRTATITLEATSTQGITPVTFTLTQAALTIPRAWFETSSSNGKTTADIEVVAAGESIALSDARGLKVESNTDWQIASSADWLSVNKASGNGDETGLVITVDANTALVARSATLTLSCVDTGGTEPHAITVKQNAAEGDDPNGIKIGNLIWANRNVGNPNEFVTGGLADVGMAYQFNRTVAWSGTAMTVTGWNTATPETGGWSTTNNVCPTGWRIPTSADFTALLNAPWKRRDNSTTGQKGYWYGNQTYSTPFPTIANPQGALFLPYTNLRLADSGNRGSGTSTSYYWSSEVNGDDVPYIFYGSAASAYVRELTYSTLSPTGQNKNSGFMVRCVKDAN